MPGKPGILRRVAQMVEHRYLTFDITLLAHYRGEPKSNGYHEEPGVAGSSPCPADLYEPKSMGYLA